MQYIIFGYNEKDEIFDNKPLLTAIGSTNIDGIILAETFLEMTKNEFIDDIKQYDALVIFDYEGQLYFKTFLVDKTLKISICSLDDKVKMLGGLIGYNYLAEKFNKENNSNLPIIPSDKLENEMIDQQNKEMMEKIKKNKEEV